MLLLPALLLLLTLSERARELLLLRPKSSGLARQLTPPVADADSVAEVVALLSLSRCCRCDPAAPPATPTSTPTPTPTPTAAAPTPRLLLSLLLNTLAVFDTQLNTLLMLPLLYLCPPTSVGESIDEMPGSNLGWIQTI